MKTQIPFRHLLKGDLSYFHKNLLSFQTEFSWIEP